MFVLLLLSAGAAVAVSMFHLVSGLSGRLPAFDRETLAHFGFVRAFAVFCLVGPVLIFRALDGRARDGDGVPIRDMTFGTLVMLGWCAALGVLSIEGCRIALLHA
ncbi:hypothetical protein [Oricola sp.]|uniref:hypothetical protein n=1 Tax=Oricola sp. TaxID=1979950 RepID=UPI003BA8F89A